MYNMNHALGGHRRFADIATECKLGDAGIYHYDINGASLKILELLSAGASFDEAKKFIGCRSNINKSEICLPDDAEGFLVFLIKQTIPHIKNSKNIITKSFKINTEVIRLAIVDALEDPIARQINLMSFDEFGVLMTVVKGRQVSLLNKYMQALKG